jgi:hypothetical protein
LWVHVSAEYSGRPRVAGPVPGCPEGFLGSGDLGPCCFEVPFGQFPRRGLALGGGLLTLGHLSGCLGGQQGLRLLLGRGAVLNTLPCLLLPPGMLGGLAVPVLGGPLGLDGLPCLVLRFGFGAAGRLEVALRTGDSRANRSLWAARSTAANASKSSASRCR